MGTLVAQRLDEPGAPVVGITLTGLPDPCTVTVERSWDDGHTWHPVRGAVEQTITGTGGEAFWRDYACPLNIETHYRTTGYSTAGVEHGDAWVTVTEDCAWLQDVLHPRAALPIAVRVGRPGAPRLMRGTATEVTRTQPVDLITPLGGRLPVASIGHRAPPAGVPIIIRPHLRDPHHKAIAAAMADLAGGGGMLLLRGLPAELGLDPVLHVVAPDLTHRTALGGVLGFQEWEATITQVRELDARIQVSWLTYTDVQVLVEDALGTVFTYDDVAATTRAGVDYLAVAANPELLVEGA